MVVLIYFFLLFNIFFLFSKLFSLAISLAFNFAFVSKLLEKSYKGEKIADVSKLAKILIEDYMTAVIPCADFGFDDHIRLSYAISMEQIKKGLDRIEQFIKDVE